MCKRFLYPLLLLALFVAACDSNGSGEDSVTGTYKLQTVNGQKLPATIVQEGTDKFEITDGHVTINGDQTFSTSFTVKTTVAGQATTQTQTQNGNYTRNGTALTFNFSDSGPEVASLDGKTLTVTSEGYVFVFQK